MRFGARGGVIPQKSSIPLKELLPKAATNLNTFCFKVFKVKAEMSLNQSQAEPFLKDDDLEEDGSIIKTGFTHM